MPDAVRICKQCILRSSTPGIMIDETGLCSECVRYNKHPGYNQSRLVEEMKERFARLESESHLYDVLLRFSGGKDSAYLLYLLKKRYHLRPLALAVMHPFVKPAAAENMERITRQLNVDLMRFYTDESLFKKFLRYGLLEGHRYGLREYAGCQLCGYIYHWLSFRIAMQMKIPFVLDGVDPTEIEKPIFIDGQAMKAALASGVKYEGVMPDIFCAACGDEYLGSIYDQNYDDLQDQEFPTSISPFTFVEYNYKEDLVELERAGIVTRQDTRSIATNCDVQHLFAYIAFTRYDRHPYETQFAIGLRKGYPTHIEQSGLDGVENLQRQDLLDWLQDYKQALYFVARNPDLTASDKETLRSTLPHMARILGPQGFSVTIDQILTMHRYARYLDIDLQQFEQR